MLFYISVRNLFCFSLFIDPIRSLNFLGSIGYDNENCVFFGVKLNTVVNLIQDFLFKLLILNPFPLTFLY